jgi:uncharacterized membrane protein
MSSPADHTALLDRIDGELADLGARLDRVRGDLGALRPAASPSAAPDAAPVSPSRAPLPGAAPAGLGPWSAGPPAPTRPGAPPPPPAGLSGSGTWSTGPAVPASSAPGPFAPPRGRFAPPGLAATGSPWAAAAAAPRRSSGLRLPRVTGARLLAVTGAGVTLVGVVLLLVLAASRGWFGAEARVVLGAVVGLVLVGAGVALQARRAAAAADGAVPAADPGPVSLAATGITALYLTVAAATSLYDLLPAPVALVLALLVAGGGLLLADRWRRHGLALGVVVGAGLLLPLVVASPGALLTALFVVLVVVTLPVAVRRAWSSLVAVAVTGATLAGLVSTAVVAGGTGVSGGTGAPVVALTAAVAALVLTAAVASLVLVGGHPATSAEAPPPGLVIAACLVVALPALPVLALAVSLPRPVGALVDVVTVVVLLGVAAVAERGVRRVPVTPALATTAAAPAAVVGLQAIPLALTGVAVGGVFLAVATVLAVIARGTRRDGVLVAAGGFGLVGAVLALGRDLPVDVVVDGRIGGAPEMLAMSVVGVLLIATAWTLLAALGRLGHLAGRNRSAVATAVLGLLGLYGAAGVVVTVALAISPTRTGFLVGHVLVTISWAALALVLLVRGPRTEAVLARVLGGVLVVAAVAKLVLFDLHALDGLARVAVFLGAGLVLLVAGARYARWVTAAGDARPTVSEEPGTLADHE